MRTRTGKAQRRPFQKVNAIEKENKPEKSLSQLRKDVQANHQQPPGMVSHKMLIITLRPYLSENHTFETSLKKLSFYLIEESF